MFFVSTRNSKVISNFKTAICDVMAPEKGGIYTPSFLTPLSYDEIYNLTSLNYLGILEKLLIKFCDGKISDNIVKQLIQSAFSQFDSGFGMDRKHCNGVQNDKYCTFTTLEENMEMVNLTYGPTGCCKDYGYNLASEFINYFAKQDGEKRTIIDISGGSSGPSVAYAVRNKEFLKCFTLLRVGKNQSVKALIQKAKAPNLSYAVVNADHNFINSIRYEVANNTSLRELANMSFINELNLMCIFAYLPIFFKAYIRCNSKPFCVSIPTGNMSLGISAYFAKKMGIPIKKIILATEKNNFFYDIQESKVAINNDKLETGCSSLHSCVPTNFERLLFNLYESNQGSVKRAMEELESNGRYKINDNLLDKFNESFYVTKCDNQFTIRNTIYSLIREKEIYVEQHYALSKMAVDIATGALGTEISVLPMIVFNTLDYRRNLRFVNASLGYDLENINVPWTKDDVDNFSPTEIQADTTTILKYIVDTLDNQDKPQENSNIDNKEVS